ncbi:MAG: twin-arginine translocation pathway signal protein [Solimicrobium sp.]|jgi:lipid-binding SYLF domain-containing protein|nr:twin-arginine translocation pathway signal protein [Solimicrobium sp.]
MNTLKLTFSRLFFASVILLAFMSASYAESTTKEDLKKDAEQALKDLYRINPTAETLSKKAKGILVFPRIVKAGLVFGGSYGEGVLMKNARVDSYYNSVSATWGWQIGVQSHGYVVFLMSDSAVKYLEKSKGWSFGVGPTVTVVDAGIAKDFNTSTLRSDAYAFIFDQKGLMAGLSIEGTKISRIHPKP